MTDVWDIRTDSPTKRAIRAEYVRKRDAVSADSELGFYQKAPRLQDLLRDYYKALDGLAAHDDESKGAA